MSKSMRWLTDGENIGRLKEKKKAEYEEGYKNNSEKRLKLQAELRCPIYIMILSSLTEAVL